MPAAVRRARSPACKLFRTTAFKLSLAYLVIFAAFAFFALGYVAWSARSVLDDQIVSTIDAEINGLSEQYNTGGLRRLISVVERRSREPGASLYLVTTRGGRARGRQCRRGSGAPALRARSGRDRLQPGRRDGRLRAPALVRIFTLPGGFRLLVGRDVEERDRLRAVISRTFGSSLALVVVLGVVGGWFVARRVLKRVDDMTETTRSIMAGDLDGRLESPGNGDELDRLAQNLNAMLERIGELMRGMRGGLRQHRPRSEDAADAPAQPGRRGPASAEVARRLRAAMESVIEESDGLIRVFNALLMIARLEAGNAREIMAHFDAGRCRRGGGALRGAGRGAGPAPRDRAPSPIS